MVVFKILNKVSGQHYVGSCRGDIFERWQLYLQAAEAGLDFPLYQEIRELGQAQFAIEEVDYAEEISELKEMELLHTVELSARSLRSHKLGLNENVVKRRRQIQHENAWKKEIPEQDRPQAEPFTKSATTKPATAKSSTAKASVTKPSAVKTIYSRPAVSKPVIAAVQPSAAALAPATKTLTPATKTPTPAAKTPTPRLSAQAATATPSTITATQKTTPVNSTPVAVTRPSKPATTDSSSQLDESLFAESIGMLVRTLSSVEQISTQQQQAKSQALALSQALAASDQALQQLQQQQDETAVKALAAMAAVEASQQANLALRAAHQQAQNCSTAALQALEQSEANATETAQLQQQLTGLLARLKPGSNKPRTHSSQVSAANSTAVENRTGDKAAVVSPRAAITQTNAAATAQALIAARAAKPTAKLATEKPAEKAPVTTPPANGTVASIKAPSHPSANAPTDTAAERQWVDAEEAKMVNQLKGLDQLLDQHPLDSDLQSSAVADQTADKTDDSLVETPKQPPTRAWISGAETAADSDKTLTLRTAAPTVIRRRNRAAVQSAAMQSAAMQNSAGQKTSVQSRPHQQAVTGLQPTVIGRKRLSIKAQR